MPVLSKPVSEPSNGPLHIVLLLAYLRLLHSRPVLTKALTSAILSALGNLLSQTIERRRKSNSSGGNVDLAAPLRFAAYGFFFTGPLSHYFYLFLEKGVPSSLPMAGLRRLLLERLIIAPAFLLLFFFVMNILEVRSICWMAINHSTTELPNNYFLEKMQK
ncbi:peroxisomal membrane protein 2 isoform X2 [Hyperolius riggenbachi]|uniref:peroxisomal membrane protein 2 isoform X2 n=1 Tax=Hyperolius riggenbachi TaxID=752182 RepID=UPI0035A2877A